MSYKPLIIIAGPTAVGKTEISIDLAREVSGEIISADSVQVYRGLDIGSAKIKPEEMRGIPHHLIDILDPGEEFNVALFKELVYKKIGEIYSHGSIPVLVGGTGFYIQAVLKDIDFSEGASDAEYRKELSDMASRKGPGFLHEMLFKIDQESAQSIPEGNVKRVIRALEFYKVTGKKISVHNLEQSKRPDVFDHRFYVLNDEREVIYSRIDKRVDMMMEEGLLSEVKGLYHAGISRDAVSMQSLGYRQIMDYLYGDISLEEAVCRIKLQTRHFAKRQITWFKREGDKVIWVNKNEFDRDNKEILEYMKGYLKEWIKH
ncbi:MAG: tRNA (adenosine(37)-N6)-dimethylallyltransferase MiaA [Lachnospiraceae bacterium]|nr:tRNA (adenosine(37)-N6)-dimethylallyltransferase MiaA [Lachnospiraceae bacterium]